MRTRSLWGRSPPRLLAVLFLALRLAVEEAISSVADSACEAHASRAAFIPCACPALPWRALRTSPPPTTVSRPPTVFTRRSAAALRTQQHTLPAAKKEGKDAAAAAAAAAAMEENPFLRRGRELAEAKRQAAKDSVRQSAELEQTMKQMDELMDDRITPEEEARLERAEHESTAVFKRLNMVYGEDFLTTKQQMRGLLPYDKFQLLLSELRGLEEDIDLMARELKSGGGQQQQEENSSSGSQSAAPPRPHVSRFDEDPEAQRFLAMAEELIREVRPCLRAR